MPISFNFSHCKLSHQGDKNDSVDSFLRDVVSTYDLGEAGAEDLAFIKKSCHYVIGSFFQVQKGALQLLVSLFQGCYQALFMMLLFN